MPDICIGCYYNEFWLYLWLFFCYKYVSNLKSGNKVEAMHGSSTLYTTNSSKSIWNYLSTLKRAAGANTNWWPYCTKAGLTRRTRTSPMVDISLERMEMIILWNEIENLKKIK